MRVLLLILALQIITPSVAPVQTTSVRKVDFADLEPLLYTQTDTVYIVNFWATWCGPCREELPHLEQIHRDYATDKVRVLLVSLDFPSVAEKSLIPFIRDNNITADVVLLDDPDANAWIDKVDPSWSGALPATLVYNKEKRIFFGKAVDYEILDDALSDLILQ